MLALSAQSPQTTTNGHVAQQTMTANLITLFHRHHHSTLHPTLSHKAQVILSK